ncbi:hypothetical protein CYJ37_06830 [Bacillus sp. UMB0728]|nr:hypothetical protein CYJ37_06830 [Bacillus sp. UMB0728]
MKNNAVRKRGLPLKPFKDKIYWTLMPVALIISIVIIFFLPIKNIYAYMTPLVFWIVYYIWTYFDEKRNKKQ